MTGMPPMPSRERFLALAAETPVPAGAERVFFCKCSDGALENWTAEEVWDHIAEKHADENRWTRWARLGSTLRMVKR